MRTITLPRFFEPWLPVLMVIVFLVAGVWGTFYCGEQLYGYWRTRALCQVPARLLAVEFHPAAHRAPAKTTARYIYEVAGRRYKGDRVSILRHTGAFYSGLHEARRSNRPIGVLIDPQQPAYATIDRTWAWFPIVVEMPFALLVFGLGLFFAPKLWKSLRRSEDYPRPTYSVHLGRH